MIDNHLHLVSHRSFWGWTVGQDTSGLVQPNFLFTWFNLPPKSKWELCSWVILRSVESYFYSKTNQMHNILTFKKRASYI
jgi:hypothetical protein